MSKSCKHPTCGENCRRVKKPQKRYRIPKITKEQAVRNRLYSIARREHLLENPFCVIRRKDRCTNVATDIHHSEGREGDKLLDKSKFISACRPCHDWAEKNPKEAKAIGASGSRLHD